MRESFLTCFFYCVLGDSYIFAFFCRGFNICFVGIFSFIVRSRGVAMESRRFRPCAGPGSIDSSIS